LRSPGTNGCRSVTNSGGRGLVYRSRGRALGGVTRPSSAKTFHLWGRFARVHVQHAGFHNLSRSATVRAVSITLLFIWFAGAVRHSAYYLLAFAASIYSSVSLLLSRPPPTRSRSRRTKLQKPRCEFVCDAVKVMAALAVPSPPACSVLLVVRQQFMSRSSSTPWTGRSCSRGMKGG
jgi:hypothetical protein